MSDICFEVQDLVKRYSSKSSLWKRASGFDAVSKVGFKMQSGRTLGLIGESGSGKSTLAKMCAGLLVPDSGRVLISGKPALFHEQTSRQAVQIVFQNPMASLNPRMKIQTSLLEPRMVQGSSNTSSNKNFVTQTLEEVGLPPHFANKYPHMLSGGECQRVAIARALSLRPKVLILDEVVSALDVIVRAQILNLLLDLQEKFRIAYLFISHDLSVIRHMSDEIIVMNEGCVVESGSAEQILSNPQHECTQKMMISSF